MAFAITSDVITSEGLVDIRDVKVDKTLPKNERIASFIRQIKNPYHFRCGDFVITTRYTEVPERTKKKHRHSHGW